MNNKVVKNAAWIICAKIVQSVLALAISMLTARYLGPSNYGLISYASSVVAFVVPVMQLGLTGTLVQELVAQPEKEGEILGTSLGLSLFSALACMVGVISFTMLANAGEKSTIIVCALYSLMLPAQAIEIIQYWYQAKLESKYASLASLSAYVIISVYKIFLLATGKGIYWFAVSNALDSAIIGCILICFYIKRENGKVRFSFSLAKRLLSRSRHYIISNMMVTIFAQTDRIMLKLMVSDAEAGYYTAAVTCATMTSFVFAAIIDSMRPVIFESKKVDELRFKKGIVALYSIIIYLSLMQSVVFAVGAPLIIRILYGSDYSNAIAVLQILVWYTTFSYMGSVRNIWILAENKQKYLWIINLSGASVNVVLNYILIPVAGAVGAAVASLITQVFTNVFIGFIIKPIRPNNKLIIEACNPKGIGTMAGQAFRKLRIGDR